MMGFSRSLGVKLLEIDCTPWGAILFHGDYHWAAPLNKCVVVNMFDDASFYVMV